MSTKRKGPHARHKGRANRDTVGVAIGAAGGAAAGLAVGSLGGPAGAALGAAVGGLAGGLAGKAVAVDPLAEEAYWQQNYRSAPYVDPAHEYTYYQPAYRFGWESYSRYGRRSFDELDEQLMRDWDCRRGESLQTWQEARAAARAAWDRVARRGRARDPRPGAGRRGSGRRVPRKGRRVPRLAR